MMLSNVEKGKAFQLRAKDASEKLLGIHFKLEVRFPIGNPPKMHPFDLASEDGKYVGETKAFTWTATGKTPSAKITTMREAVQYLRALPKSTKTFMVLLGSRHPTRREILAEYFVRLNQHLLAGIAVLELNDDETLRILRRGSW